MSETPNSPTSSADFSLSDLRTVISEKYKPTAIEIGEGRIVRLVQIARLPEEKQEQLLAMQDEFNELKTEGAKLNASAKDVTPEDLATWFASLDRDPTPAEVDEFKRSKASAGVSHEQVKAYRARTVGVLERMLVLVGQTESEGQQLVDACNHDELMLMEVFTRYSKKTKLGEASASSSSSETTAGPSSTTSENSSGSTSAG